MSHIIQLDFQRRRFVAQEITILDNPIVPRFKEYDRLKRQRDAVRERHGENGYVNTACPCKGCREFFAAHTVNRIGDSNPEGVA